VHAEEERWSIKYREQNRVLSWYDRINEQRHPLSLLQSADKLTRVWTDTLASPLWIAVGNTRSPTKAKSALRHTSTRTRSSGEMCCMHVPIRRFAIGKRLLGAASYARAPEKRKGGQIRKKDFPPSPDCKHVLCLPASVK
jgi:hypothetical protein